MITKEDLKDTARISRLKLYQQEKHYIQTIILNAIYSSAVSRELVFKGGTALMFFYGLPRFSEDLDFTMNKPISIDNLISAIKKDLEVLGIRHTITKVEDNEVSMAFKVGAEGPLFIKEIERCFVNIEISKRENVENVKVIELRSIYKDIIGFSLSVMAEKEILAEKVRALLTRNKARDLFDIYFLMRWGLKIDEELTNRKLKYYNRKFNKGEFMNSIINKKDIWLQELSPIIIGPLPSFREVRDFLIKRNLK